VNSPECAFYQSYARAMAGSEWWTAGWRRTRRAVNIIGRVTVPTGCDWSIAGVHRRGRATEAGSRDMSGRGPSLRRAGVGAKVRGVAWPLVAKDGFSARRDTNLDPLGAAYSPVTITS